jgi:hypothetical protein
MLLNSWKMSNGMRISRKPLSVLQIVAVTVILLSLVVLVLWANDVRKDREKTVTVISPTPVFVGSGSEDDSSTPRRQTAIEKPGTTLHVRRIRYWKDCATVNVVLPDGRSGHIVLGVGDVSLHPPLN